jgi:SOS-response transcriptional repressor LexA
MAEPQQDRTYEEIANENRARVYAFLRAYIAAHGRPPTAREIAAEVRLAVSTVLRHLDKLELEGRIRRDPYIARGITLLDNKDES